jgi:hypothetical protein
MRTNFRKQKTLKILFSDEKMFDIDEIYKTEKDRSWAVNLAEADKKSAIQQKKPFSQKVMVWLGVCSEGIYPLVIFDEGTVDHTQYIEEMLPIALKYGNKVFGNYWAFQQDRARPHIYHLTRQQCQDNFQHLSTKDIGHLIILILIHWITVFGMNL